jgi:hypothetical protein
MSWTMWVLIFTLCCFVSVGFLCCLGLATEADERRVLLVSGEDKSEP